MFASIIAAVRQAALHREWERTARSHFCYGKPEYLEVNATDDDETAESLAISTKGLVWGARPELAVPIEEGRDLLARNKSERLVSVVYTDL